MKRVISTFIIFLPALFLVLATRSFSADLSPEKEMPIFLENKTFDRWPDPVVADCGLFTPFLGKKIELLRVYAYTDKTFLPIPFQIDEKDDEGNRIFPSGEKANPQDGNGLIDKGEELVFMARDCGDRISPQIFPAEISLWQELELQDPLTQKKGWVYLLYSETAPPPLSPKDYILYIPDHKCENESDCQLIKSKYLEDHFYPQEPYADLSKYPNKGFAHMYMAVPPEAGGTGEDFVDRFKGRITIAFFFGLLKYNVTEKVINFYESAYKDGPVRLIRNIQLIITLPLKIRAPGIAVDLLWYDTIVDVPMIIDLPINPKYLYTYLEIKIGEDHGPGAIGMKVYNSNNLQGCLVDGKTTGAAETDWNRGRDEWRLMTGEQGTVMNRSFWDEHYLKQMKSITVDYIDDINRKDPPEDDPGMLGMILQTNRVEGIKKERYFSYLEWYWPPAFLFSGPGQTYQAGDEKIYLNIADHPVKLRTGELTMDSHYFGKMQAYDRAEKIMEKKREAINP